MSKLYFRTTHEWAKIDGNTASVGISAYAAKELGDIVYIGLPEVGTCVKAGEMLCDVESVKAVSDIYAPVSGTVISVNEALLDAPELLNEAAMETSICVIETDGAVDGLLSEAEYAELLKK